MTTAMESIMRSHSRTATCLRRASVGWRVGITGAIGCADVGVAGNCSGWAFSPGGRVEDEGYTFSEFIYSPPKQDRRSFNLSGGLGAPPALTPLLIV